MKSVGFALKASVLPVVALLCISLCTPTVSNETTHTEQERAYGDIFLPTGTRNAETNNRETQVSGGEVAHTYTMEATAYTWTGYRTATGTWPSRGTIATDPRVIPLGTELYIEGYGPAVAADTGGDIKGQRVDLYMDSYEEAIQFGRREVQVEAVREGDGY